MLLTLCYILRIVASFSDIKTISHTQPLHHVKVTVHEGENIIIYIYIYTILKTTLIDRNKLINNTIKIHIYNMLYTINYFSNLLQFLQFIYIII